MLRREFMNKAALAAPTVALLDPATPPLKAWLVDGYACTALSAQEALAFVNSRLAGLSFPTEDATAVEELVGAVLDEHCHMEWNDRMQESESFTFRQELAYRAAHGITEPTMFHNETHGL